VPQIVRAGPELKPTVIAGEAEGLGQGLVGQGPVAVNIAGIIDAALQEDPDRLSRGDADHVGVVVPAQNVHEGAAMAQHPAKAVGELPSAGEGADAAAANAADGAVGGVA